MLGDFQTIFQIRSLQDLVLAIIDISLVSYLCYRVLVMIRGTKAVPILVSMFLILAGFFVTKDEYLGLSAINWLLENVTAAFILLVIVLFQEDIRRGLAGVGRARLFLGLTTQREELSVEEIVRACTSMSQARLGALIAIERDADLSEYADEGIQIDAQITHELLYSLFNPNFANPTHDGALIIQGGRIRAAGCFLPLTTNPHISKSLGTRHRAGIGFTEKTDAVVCIVSEETGNISIAFQGQLTRDLDANSLREHLQTLLAFKELPREKKPNNSIVTALRSVFKGKSEKKGTE